MLPADPRELRKSLMGIMRSSGGWAKPTSRASSGENQINVPKHQTMISDINGLARALAARWREKFMPHEMDARYKREWNLFLSLEVAFFFPLRHGGPIPANIGQIGVLLSDREHIALAIADGNQEQAASYLTSKHEGFWKSIVPCNEALPYSTVNNRIDRAVRLLATIVQPNHGFVEKCETADSEQSCPKPMQLSLSLIRSSALSRYLESGLPNKPRFVPDEWRTLIEVERLDPATIIRGRTGTGKTQLMKWLSQEIRRKGATPLYVSLPSFALHSSHQDIVAFASTHGRFASQCRDASITAALQAELAEEEHHGSLVLLADCPDELLEGEIEPVANALSPFKRVVVGERCESLLLDRQPACTLDMPQLHPESLVALLKEYGVFLGLPFEVIDEIRILGLEDNLALVIGTVCSPAILSPALQVRLGIEKWIDQRLKTTRQALDRTVNLLVARKLLEILARIEARLEGPEHEGFKLNAERINYAVRQLGIWVKPEIGLEAFSFLQRTGLVNFGGIGSVLSYPGLSMLAEKRPLVGWGQSWSA
jgi:hypothetical protein